MRTSLLRWGRLNSEKSWSQQREGRRCGMKVGCIGKDLKVARRMRIGGKRPKGKIDGATEYVTTEGNTERHRCRTLRQRWARIVADASYCAFSFGYCDRDRRA